jgi:hypothetical protein
MSKRFNNKRLFFLLACLIAVLALTIVIKIPRENATLKNKIVEFDSTEVNKIMLYPRINKGHAIEFTRNAGNWKVQQGAIIAATQKGAVQNILTELLSIKPQSLVARNKSKWEEFELTDSLATQIKFLNIKGKILADLMIGKFSYKQMENPYGAYGRNNIQGTSYVRLTGEKEVYSVDGFISFSVNRKFEEWRDNSFIRSNKNDVLNIRFIYPSDSSFVLTKRDSVWYDGNRKTDSLKVENFLNTLSYLNGQDFKDNFKPSANPDFELLIDGNNLLNVSVKCYKADNDYFLNSSLNPEVYFSSKKNDIFDKLFKPESYFLKQKGDIKKPDKKNR